MSVLSRSSAVHLRTETVLEETVAKKGKLYASLKHARIVVASCSVEPTPARPAEHFGQKARNLPTSRDTRGLAVEQEGRMKREKARKIVLVVVGLFFSATVIRVAQVLWLSRR